MAGELYQRMDRDLAISPFVARSYAEWQRPQASDPGPQVVLLREIFRWSCMMQQEKTQQYPMVADTH